jgi:hypothetical protein
LGKKRIPPKRRTQNLGNREDRRHVPGQELWSSKNEIAKAAKIPKKDVLNTAGDTGP